MDKFNTRTEEVRALLEVLLHTTRRMWLLLRESTGILEIFRAQSGVQLKDLYRDKRLPKHVPVRLWKEQINRHLLQHINETSSILKLSVPGHSFFCSGKMSKNLGHFDVTNPACTKAICRGPWRADGIGNEVGNLPARFVSGREEMDSSLKSCLLFQRITGYRLVLPRNG